MRKLLLLGITMTFLSACGAAPQANIQQRAVLQATPNAYRIINLSSLSQAPQPSLKFVPVSLTNDDQLLGFASLGTSLGFRSLNPADGSLSSLPTATGANFSITNANIFSTYPARSNNLGQIVGRVTGSNNIVVRNPDGSLIDLGAYLTTGTAWGINNNGQIFGNTGTGGGSTNSAFVGDIKTGVFTTLGSFYFMTAAFDMNSSGQVVGRSGVPLRSGANIQWHAFVTTPTGLKDLHAPSMPVVQGGVTGSTAFAINDSGIAVGEYPYQFTAAPTSTGIDAQMHGVVWNTNTNTYTDIGKPNTRSSLRDINTNGDAVGAEWVSGSSFGSYSNHGTLVNTTTGNAVDLNSMVLDLPTGWYISSADSINDHGLIIATARTGLSLITTYKYLLVPTTLPVGLPASPSNLVGTAISGTQIKLSWTDNANNESAQILERCTGESCVSPLEISLAANVTTYTDSGLQAGMSYQYRLRARGVVGDSLRSDLVYSRTFAPPAIPTNITITANTRSQISMSWTDNSSDETSFLIERCVNSGCVDFSPIASVAANVTSFINTGLRPNTNYSYRVRAVNANGTSGYSGWVSVSTLF